MKPLFIFMHIPKTAGTTFIDVLNRNFEGKELNPVSSRGESISRWSHKIPPYLDYKNGRGDFDKLQCIHGHLTYDEFEALECFKHRQKIYLTFLRNPVERSWSMFHFSRRNSTEDKFYEWLREDTKENYTQRINSMVYALTNHDTMNQDSLLLATERLESMAYGITEHFDKSLDLFQKEFPSIFKVLQYVKRNVAGVHTKPKPKEIPPDIEFHLMKLNHWDNILYHWALDRFI